MKLIRSICVSIVFFAAGASLVSADSGSGIIGTQSSNRYRIVEASKAEPGLMVYSNVAEYNWRAVRKGFMKKYPWIKLETIDLGPAKVFERYYSENAINARTADLIVTGAPDGWRRFAARGELVSYQSPNENGLPEWSMPLKGLYTISVDPMLIVYNKILLGDVVPYSLKDIVDISSKNVKKYQEKITTYNAAKHSFAYDVHWAASAFLGDKAGVLQNALGSVARTESGGALMVEKITTGEYSIGYYVSGIHVFLRMKQTGRAKVLGWNLIADGTPVFSRNMGITKAARSPGSAMLLMEYILSPEGQVAVGKGGLTPYATNDAERMPSQNDFLTYQDIVAQIGEENVIHVKYDPAAAAGRDAYLARWRQAFRLNK